MHCRVFENLLGRCALYFVFYIVITATRVCVNWVSGSWGALLFVVHVPRPCFCPSPKGGLTDRLRVNKRAPYSNGPFVIILPSLSLSLSPLSYFCLCLLSLLCICVLGVCVLGVWCLVYGRVTMARARYLIRWKHNTLLLLFFCFFYNIKKTLQVINQKARPCHNKNNMQNRHIRAFALHY